MPKNPLLTTGSAPLDIRVNLGAFYDPIILFVDKDGFPQDLSGYTHVELKVWITIGAASPLLTVNDTLTTLVYISPQTHGKVQFAIDVTTLSVLLPGTYYHDIYLTDALGHPKKWTAGLFTVTPRGSV